MPNQKMQLAEKLRKTINQSGCLFKVTKGLEVEGYSLKAPEIKIGRKTIKPEKGRFQLRSCPLKEASTFTREEWVMVHSSYNKRKCDEFLDLLKKASTAFGITVEDPIFFEIEKPNSAENWIKDLKADF